MSDVPRPFFPLGRVVGTPADVGALLAVGTEPSEQLDRHVTGDSGDFPEEDTKYVKSFDAVFTGEGRKIKKTTARSPNLQAFVERVIQTLKHEVLNAFRVVSEKHLDHILKIGADWYNHRRGHTGRDHLPPVRDSDDPPLVDLAKHKLVCHTELGGHLKSYRAAA